MQLETYLYNGALGIRSILKICLLQLQPPPGNMLRVKMA
jgi:hypothetical protein